MTVDPSRRPRWPLALLLVVAALWLGWRAGSRYLWQDEAACAVLAERFLEHGEPLAYDGRNLITMDRYEPTELAELEARSSDAQRTVDFFRARGDFAPDTAWTAQPWGQFAVAGIALRVLGHGTWQARAPFVAAAVATVVVLFAFARRRFADPWIAWLAVALLLANTFWFLHARQCRYYSLASLGLVATVVTYFRWRTGRERDAVWFVLAAFAWFQCDFGSPLPVLLVLGIDALRDPGRRRATIVTFVALALALVPFVFLYRMGSRVQPTHVPWTLRLAHLAGDVNQFQLPFVAALVALFFVTRDRAGVEARVIGVCLAIAAAKIVVLPAAIPFAFYRYVVDMTPLAALVVAFAAARSGRAMTASRWRPLVACGLVAVQIASGALAAPIALVLPDGGHTYGPRIGLRKELAALRIELDPATPDCQRELVEALAPRLGPDDELIVTYPDAPWMFYTRCRVRGGMAAFRVLEPGGSPRFALMQGGAGFVPWRVYERVASEARWKRLPVGVIDLPWGSNPDPRFCMARMLEIAASRDDAKVLVLESRGP